MTVQKLLPILFLNRPNNILYYKKRKRAQPEIFKKRELIFVNVKYKMIS